MRLIRFCIQLAGNIGLIVAGGSLLAMGAWALLAVNIVGAFIDKPAPLDGQTFRDMLTGPDGEFDAALWRGMAVIAGELLVGFVLFFVGFRGMMHRLAHGLPPAEHAAESQEGRIGHVLGYGLGIVLGLFLMGSALAGNARVLLPKLLGTPAVAVVTDSRTEKGRDMYHNYLTYRFETPNGSRIKSEFEVPPKFLREHASGTEVNVLYMPSDPTHNMLPDVVSYTGFTITLGFHLFLIVAGIAGVRRNLNYQE